MATTDARIAVGLPQHPKTKKLVKRLGQAAAWNLVCLILWAASNRSDGDLTGMSVEDIELAADWIGEDGAFVRALVDVKFLDDDDDGFVLHDWHEHNPWAAGAEMRSAKARWNAAKRHHGVAEADRLVPEYAAIRSATSNASSKTLAEGQQQDSNAPSPSPSPSPSLNTSPDGDVATADETAEADPCPHQAIIALYHELCPVGRQVREWTPARAQALRSRWREKPSRQNLDWWRRFFEYVSKSDFLMGRVNTAGKRPFEVSLDWLVKSENFVKVIEGKFENSKEAA